MTKSAEQILKATRKALVKIRDEQRGDESKALNARFARIAAGKSVTYKLEA